MPYIKSKTCFKINVGAKYALMELEAGTFSFTLIPTDASYEPISVTNIDDSYSSLYYEAVKIAAIEKGMSDGTTEEAIEQRIAWVKDASQIDITHNGGTYTLTKASATDGDVFDAAIVDIAAYLEEKGNLKT